MGALAAPNDPRCVELAYAQALVVAVVFVLFWLFRLGFLANFLSKAALVGLMSGLGIEALTSQIVKIMGIHVDSEDWFGKVVGILQGIPRTNLYTLAVGVGRFGQHDHRDADRRRVCQAHQGSRCRGHFAQW